MRKRIFALGALIIFMASLMMAGKRVVFAGDSVTDGGWGRSGGSAKSSAERNQTDQNHIYGHSYMLFCAAEFLNRCPEAGHEFFNRGISGDDLARMEARWQADVIALHPDIVSILVGTNDVHYSLENGTAARFDAEGWERRYRALLDTLRANHPEVKIILGTPFCMKSGRLGSAPDYAMRDSLTRRLAAIVRHIADDYNALTVGYDSLFTALLTEHPTVAPEYWIWDGIHPTPAAHRRMADLWSEVAAPLFSDEAPQGGQLLQQ